MILGIVYVVAPAIAVIVLVRKYKESTWGKCKELNSLHNRVFLVTGANSGIGMETVRGLALRKARIILACRSMEKAQSTIQEIRKTVLTGDLIPMEVDMASLKSVQRFSDEVLKDFPQIHCLINNAGVIVPDVKNEKTKDGFEIHFGVNHLSHFLLTKLLLDRLKQSAPSRIIIVSSTLHERGVIDFDNLNLEKGYQHLKSFSPGYSNSKLANAYFCKELAQRTAGSGVEVYMLCPGFCYTGLFRNTDIKWYQYITFLPIALLFMRSAAQGSQTVLHCAVSESLKGFSGQFFRDCKLYKSKVDFQPEIAAKLWEESEEAVSKTLKLA